MLATVNMVGGFVVTDRMLEMFKGRKPASKTRGSPTTRAARMTKQTWVDLAYLVAAVCFILALKGLSSPKTARNGNLIGAFGAALAVVTTLVAQHLDHLPLILGGIAVGTVVGGPGRPAACR